MENNISKKALMVMLAAITAFALVAEPALAQTSQTSVQTDKANYSFSDIIKVSGEVQPDNLGEPVVIKVLNPIGSIYRIDQIEVDSSGSYSYELAIGGSLGIDGQYTVVVSYGNSQAETTFGFAAADEIDVTIDGKKHRIRVGGHSHAQFLALLADRESKSLILDIANVTEDGTLQIEVDAALIDTTGECFVVHVDDQQVEAQCTEKDADTWIIEVPIQAGAEEIRFTGSFLVPEFGSIAAIMLAIAISSILVISAKRGRLLQS